MVRRVVPFNSRRCGFSYRGMVVVLAVVLVLPAIAWSVWPSRSWNSSDSGLLMHTVERGEFVHEITDRGNLESSENIEVKCEVKSKGLTGTQMLEVVPEGTQVQEGDVLVKLDSSALETDRINQLIAFYKSAAEVIQAKAACQIARDTQKEYEEGTHDQQVQGIENEIRVAKENRNRAEDTLKNSTRLFAKGYVTALQWNADRFALEKAETDLAMARRKLDVFEKYTHKKEVTRLQRDIDTADAKLQAADETHKLDEKYLTFIQEQIDKCVIKAPKAGQVVYANVTGYRGNKEVMIAAGEMARERQVLIRLPDPTRMQVVAKVNESKIAMVAPGMSARIRLDAFPDMELEGTVKKLDEFPVPTSFFGSTVKEYETTITIHGSPPGLRPGLTAQVKILVERLPEVVQVPVQSLFEHGGRYYCIFPEGRRFTPAEVQIGSTNDKFVVIREGVQEGQAVVLNAAAYREKVSADLPELPAENGRGAARVYAERAGRAKPGAAVPDDNPPESPEPAELAKRMFAQWDRNRDGRLDPDEVPEAWRARLQGADASNDGALDPSELARALGRAPGRGQGGRPQGSIAP